MKRITNVAYKLFNRASTRPKWERFVILGILIATAILYTISASKNGYANSFYAEAVQAGTKSWKAMFFGSLDASNFITVDKPPFALWMMEISTRIFGFHSWSMLLPEVLAGVGTVYVVYATVRRWFDSSSALLAAAVMSLTPVAVLMFGFNNPDAVLTFLLAASVYTVVRALEGIRPLRWLTLSAVLSGCAFNTKMIQGLIVVPALVLIYLIAAKPRFWVRVKHLIITAVPLLIACLWWPLIISATPAADRPYIGSSTNNSIWNLIVGYNGVGRLLGTSSGQGGGVGGGTRGGQTSGFPGGGTAPTRTTGTSGTPNFTPPAGIGTPPTGIRPIGGNNGRRGGMGGGPGGSGFGGSTGIFRMFNTDFGPNIGWFIPASMIGVGTALWQRRRQPLTDKVRAGFIVWGLYLILHIVVFSMVSGVIHPYYPVVMAPAVAALVGMSMPMMFRSFRRGGNGALVLPVAVVATGIIAYIVLGYQTSFLPWLRLTVLIASLVVAIAMLAHIFELLKRYTLALGISAVIVCGIAPVAYALDTATVVHTGSVPSAGPEGTGLKGSNNETASAESSLVSYLVAHQTSTTKWLVAVDSANESAPIQLSSGQPVMAVGGFNGSDAAITLKQFEALVNSGKLSYYAVAGAGAGMGGGNNSSNSAIVTWVKAYGTIVNYGGSSYTLYKV